MPRTGRKRHELNLTRHILILIGHTGGGHLRAAEAICEALHRRYGEAASVKILDALGDYAPFPLNRLADIYPRWIDHAVATWDWGYRLTDGRRRATALLRLCWLWVWPGTRRLLSDHPADAIVSVHPLTNHVLAWALRRLGRSTPLLTLVTDPVSVHPLWLSPEVDRCLVGSAEAQQKALACGLRPGQVRITGLPVNPRFVDGLTNQAQARRALNWSPDRPVVLMIGGGEGMGQLYSTARAIEVTCSTVQLAIVTGRNRRLQEKLATAQWRVPTHVYGYVDHSTQMPRLMSAADLLITKAGPGTLYEAFLAGLPLILNGAIPGQEDGNVRLVIESEAGVWAPDPRSAAAQVARWINDKDTLAQVGACSRALAQPSAAAAAADEIWQLADYMESGWRRRTESSPFL